MRKSILLLIIALGSLFATIQPATGQFFYNGRGSASIKWKQLQGESYKLLYPDFFEPTAIRMSSLYDTLRPYIGYGMTNKLLKVPMIFYTENQYPNGLVVWAPKRDEMVVTAPVNNTSTPWLNQVAIHEWRHVAQMSSLNTGLSKVASWLFGQAGLCVGLLVISDWQLEGDATNAETQMSEYGRGLQPDFTIEYRAMATKDNFLKLKTDLLVCGSYKTYIPDIYKYGYQIMSAAETYVKPEIWGEVFSYSARWPIFVVPDDIYLKRHYQTSIRKITKQAFAELDSIWKPLGNTVENFETFTKPAKTYTTFDNPILLPNKTLLALRTDFDSPTRYVLIDSAGNEKKMRYTGGINSRPATKGTRIYWTEYKPHPIYEFKNFSVIRQYDLRTGKSKRYRNWESNYLVTPLDNGFATIANDSLANGYIRYFDEHFIPLDRYKFSIPTTLHGLAWDSLTKALCFIAVDQRGMWIGALDSCKNVTELRPPSAVTLSDLRADNGTLYFGSIQSGKDEVHAMDIRRNREYQLTTSRFGSGQPIVQDSTLYMRTYTDKGWMLARQTIDTTTATEVSWQRLPENLVNPQRTKWKVPDANAIILNDSVTPHKTKRFRKFGRQFNFHSWAPVAVDWNALNSERTIRMGFGATGFFQSTLSDMYGALAVGAMAGEFWTVGSFTYTGLPVQISASAEYGGGNQSVYIPSSITPDAIPQVDNTPYFSVTGTLSAPINLSGGHSFRTLQPSFSITHYNAKLYDPEAHEFNKGYQKWNASLWWSSTRRSAYRDIIPRLGYALRASVSGTLDQKFSLQYSLWSRAYLPGIFKTHSMMLRVAGQHQRLTQYNFSNKVLYPRGIVDNYAAKIYGAASFDYSLPLLYPDWGWNGVIYFKRIYANLFADYSIGSYFTSTGTKSINHHSWGVDLNIDFNLLRSFNQEIKLTFAFPESSSFYFAVGYNFKF